MNSILKHHTCQYYMTTQKLIMGMCNGQIVLKVESNFECNITEDSLSNVECLELVKQQEIINTNKKYIAQH